MGGAGLRRPVAAMASLLLLPSLASCASSEHDDVARVADDFVAAVARGDSEEACGLLAPATVEELERSSGSCADAVLDQARPAGPRERVSTFGSMSQVRYADDVLFLSRFEAGWRVVAAGCLGQRGAPYACGIEGR